MVRLTLLCLAVATALPRFSNAQTHLVTSDFSITLEREGCLGTCPQYSVTICADGSVQYDGEFYVHAKGARRKTIPVSNVEKLVQRLQDEDVFAWEEKKTVCLDVPKVHIAVTLNGRHKDVLEGCDNPGKVLTLADAIDKIAGTKYWVGHEQTP